MNVYKQLREMWKKPAPLYKEKTRVWTRENVIVKIDRPTRLDRARALGYKAKQGYIIARTRVKKGGRRRPKITKGRKPKHYGQVHFTTGQNKQSIAEKRVNRKYPNMEVLNSYYVGENGQYKFYEIILVDKNHAVIKKDNKMKWITKDRRRVYRGRTSAAKKSRK